MDSVSRYGKEFQEIGHCGGQFTVNVETTQDGRRAFRVGVRSSRPTPASWFAVYALPQGIPVGTVHLGGIGSPLNDPPVPRCFPIFVASDILSMFGHQCPKCAGYWRSRGAPSRWRMTCPYCGLRADIHSFLTEGQLKYVKACCELVEDALRSENDGEHVIDMDEVADAIGKEAAKPEYYYAEESQQNKYTCQACGDRNDILGRYGYCSTCGTYNGLSELEHDLNGIRERIGTGQQYEACVKDAVSAFDSYARQVSKQVATRIPMRPVRTKEWERKVFHNLKRCAEGLNTIFGINLFDQLRQDDVDFAILMFHRRHVYEHNGGEVDDKYIRDSGDTSVRPKQVIRETDTSALRIADLVLKMGRNLHDGFHDIFPPEQAPLKIHQRRADSKQKA